MIARGAVSGKAGLASRRTFGSDFKEPLTFVSVYVKDGQLVEDRTKAKILLDTNRIHTACGANNRLRSGDRAETKRHLRCDRITPIQDL